jgi:hypothetical protein
MNIFIFSDVGTRFRMSNKEVETGSRFYSCLWSTELEYDIRSPLASRPKVAMTK